MASHSLFKEFLSGKAPKDLRQKIYQKAFEKHQAIIDLLEIAIPEIKDLKPIVEDLRVEEPYFSWIKPKNKKDKRKILAEERADYLVRLHLEKISCDIWVFILHQSHRNTKIELELLNYIVQHYLKDSENKKPLLHTLALILNANVHSSWRPKTEFQEILVPTDNPLLKKSSLNFKIWSVNVNDPHLKEFAKDKPLMVLLLLEALRRPGLKVAEAIEILKDSLEIIDSMNQSGDYEQVIWQEALLVCATFPQNPEVKDAIIAFLKENRYVDEKEAKEMRLYVDELGDKRFKQGQLEVAQRLTLKLAQKYLGENPHLADRLKAIEDYDTLENLNDLLLKGDTEEFTRVLEKAPSKKLPLH